MRTLIVGAGATGGAFGTLLQEAGRDVTYLLRPARAARLRRDGLRFISPEGDRTNQVQTLVAGEPAAPFDLVIVAVKAYALDAALEDLRPYVGPKTLIMPILNGMAQIDKINAAFPGQLLGGIAKIVATLDGDAVHQMTPLCTLTIGDPNRGTVPAEVIDALTVPGITMSVSGDILQGLWEKWAFIAAGGVISCLFRAPIGRILDAGGHDQIIAAITELEDVAAAAGHPVSEAAHGFSIGMLTEPGSIFTSSLYRDLIAGGPTESEHILGNFQAQARRLDRPTPMLDLTLIQIRAGQ